LDPPERFKKRLRDFWQSRVDETWRAEQERDEFRRLLRDYGLAQNPSEDAKKRLRLFYGVGVLDPREGYDTRLRNFYGVAGATASVTAVVGEAARWTAPATSTLNSASANAR